MMGSFSQDTESTQNGRILKTVSTNNLVIFEAKEEVLAVDPKGLPFRESFTIDKFTNLENGVTTNLLKPGSVILTDGSQQGANQFVIKDGVMDDAARTFLARMMPPHKPGSPSDDDIYGTKEQKGVGDRWTINKQLAIDDLKDAMIIPIEKMTGVTSIVSRGNFGGEDCLNMLGEVNADGVVLRMGPMGFVPAGGTMDMTFRACVPISPAGKSRKEGAVMSALFSMKGAPGTEAESIVVETKLNQRIEITELPIQ
jgi:hypothetical protein